MNKPLLERAWEYVWRHHGRGLSTAMGIHTRQTVADAYAAGYRAALRSKRK